MKATSTIHFVTWHCGRCKQKQSTPQGSRTVITKDGRKIKVCADCAKDLPPPVRRR